MIIENYLKRLLCIVGKMDAGGAETFLMKVYRALDKTKYQMDFYVASDEAGFYDNEIISMGGKIYRSTPKSKGFLKSFLLLRKTIRKQKYDFVLRISQHSLSSLDLLAAKLGGARNLIFRSSNTCTNGKAINQLLHKLFKWLSMSIPTVKIAPSTEAAEFMFGQNCIKKGKATIIKNAIFINKYIFQQEIRDKFRKELKIEDKFVIGHVGRLNYVKNHDFLIDIFSNIVKKHEKSILILVGKGELEIDIKNKIESLGLTNKVIFTGVRSDIPDIMMAMDVFILPSLFEGLPNTIIEAQATGLNCIISDSITRETDITKLVHFLSLKDSSEIWAEKALEFSKEYEHKNMKYVFIREGYDIYSMTENFRKTVFCENISI